MKKWGGIIVVAAVTIFALAEIVYDFVTNDPVHYFAEQPRSLLLVALISVAAGLITLVFENLSRQRRRFVKLCTLGLAASVLMVFATYFFFEFVPLSHQHGALAISREFILVPLIQAAISFLLWLEFYQAYKRRVE